MDKLKKSTALFALPLPLASRRPGHDVSDGEVFTRNKKYLLKDLAEVNPWNSEPPPPVREPALDAPKGRGPPCCCVRGDPAPVVQRTRSASPDTE